MAQYTSVKGDLGVAKVIADLTEKGFDVFSPTISESLPFDLIGYKDNKCIRFQVKYRKNGLISKGTYNKLKKN